MVLDQYFQSELYWMYYSFHPLVDNVSVRLPCNCGKSFLNLVIIITTQTLYRSIMGILEPAEQMNKRHKTHCLTCLRLLVLFFGIFFGLSFHFFISIFFLELVPMMRWWTQPSQSHHPSMTPIVPSSYPRSTPPLIFPWNIGPRHLSMTSIIASSYTPLVFLFLFFSLFITNIF